MEEENIKLIIEKGPKEGESIEYKSNKIIKIGRVVRGNTFQIKESGISSNHISIHFDSNLNQWILTDLDSSNGTFLNTLKLQPAVGTALTDGDCIKIGELTSILVKIGMPVAQPVVEFRRNARRQGRSKPVVEETSKLGLADKLGEIVVEEGVGKRVLRARGKNKAWDSKNVAKIVELGLHDKLGESVVEEGVGKRVTRARGKNKPVDTNNVVESAKIVELGLDDKLGESVAEEGVGKRILRARGKKAVVESAKNVVESASSKRILRSSKKAEKVAEVPELSNIPEEITDASVAVEPKNKRARKKKSLPVDISEGTGLDEQNAEEAVPSVGRRTRRGRTAMPAEPLKNLEIGGIEENVNEIVRVDEGNGANKEPSQDQAAEKLVLTEECRDGKEPAAEGSSVRGSSKVADVDKEKKVTEELESRQDGVEGSMKKTEPDSQKWDLEKMTLGDFFDYLEGQLPKEIIDSSEKIIADLEEKARQSYRIRQKCGKQ